MSIVLSFPTYAAGKTSNDYIMKNHIQINKDLEFIVETRELQENIFPIGNEEISVYSQPLSGERVLPDQETSKTFEHRIYDRNNKLLAVMLVHVTGIYSQVDSWAEITNIYHAFSSGEISTTSQLIFDTTLNGADGYLDLYFGSRNYHVTTLHYRISTNGAISLIQ